MSAHEARLGLNSFIHSQSCQYQFLALVYTPLFHCVSFVGLELPQVTLWPATTAPEFLYFSLVDQLYAKEVYFCSFVTKSNLACTKYLSKCIQQFSQDHHTWKVLQDFHKSPPSKRHFTTFHYRAFFLCWLPIFALLDIGAARSFSGQERFHAIQAL